MQDEIQVLVIDADPVERSRITKFLEDKECKVYSTEDPQAGLKIVSEQQPDIIFTDIEFSEISRCDLLRGIHGENPHALVGVIAKTAEQEAIILSLDAGVRAFLRRPVTETEIASTLFRFRGIIQRGRNRTLRPESFTQFQLNLELASSKDAIIPSVAAVLSLVAPYVKDRDLRRMELALHEIIRNSYEHGNLGVSFDEKRELLASGHFEERLEELAVAARREGKVIRVNVAIDRGLFRCSVCDAGKGFNWRAAVAEAGNVRLLETENLHGRGLILVFGIFDHVSFNESGNEITVTKRLYHCSEESCSEESCAEAS